jgi:hypothetical protein
LGRISKAMQDFSTNSMTASAAHLETGHGRFSGVAGTAAKGAET